MAQTAWCTDTVRGGHTRSSVNLIQPINVQSSDRQRTRKW